MRLHPKRFRFATLLFLGVALLGGNAQANQRSARVSDARLIGRSIQLGVRAQKQGLVSTQYASRSLRDHLVMLGPGFFGRLRGLVEGQHLIDAGSSAEPVLVGSYLYSTPEGGAHVTAIGLEKAHPGDLLSGLMKEQPRFTYRGERFFESYRPGELEPADLMFDAFGPQAYTHQLSRIMKREIETLKVGGMLTTHGSPRTRIVDRQGRDVYREWVRAIRGVEVTDRSQEGFYRFDIERTADAVHVPKLRLVGFVPGHPPERVFLWQGAPRVLLQPVALESAGSHP